MASRYWVGGGSSTNWSATGNTNWSATDGGANNASVPATGDDVFFTSNSGAGASVISASQSIGSLDCTGCPAKTITHNTSVTLTIDGVGGIFKLVANITWTIGGSSSLFSFNAASGTTAITSAGKTIPATTFGTSGTSSATFQIQDAITFASNGATTLTSGTLDANNFAVSLGSLTSSNSNTRTITMGTGTWTLTGSSGNASWNFATATGLTITANTATVTWSNTTTAVETISSGGKDWNGLTISLPAGTGSRTYTHTGNNAIFANLNIGSGNIFIATAVQTISLTNAPTWTGTNAAPIGMRSTVASSSATISITSGTLSLAWGVIQRMTFSGGATFNATNSLDAGSNSGITITPPTTTTGGASIIGG